MTIDVVCSLTTGDVTWTASANNSTSTVAGSVVITVATPLKMQLRLLLVLLNRSQVPHLVM